MDTTIICLGNRLIPEDAAGPAVYDRLKQLNLPEDVHLMEGGTAGLNLIPLLERCDIVIFVDSVCGYTREGDIVLLEKDAITCEAGSPRFGHDPDLPYVLAVLPRVSSGKIPEKIMLIGIEGKWTPAAIEQAADLCLTLVEKSRGV